jgi:hypothetical protein
MTGQPLGRIVEPAAVESERVVQSEPGGERRSRRKAAAPERNEEWQRADKMRRDVLPNTSFVERLAHKAELEITQITQSTMNEFRIVRACGVGEIASLNQRRL